MRHNRPFSDCKSRRSLRSAGGRTADSAGAGYGTSEADDFLLHNRRLPAALHFAVLRREKRIGMRKLFQLSVQCGNGGYYGGRTENPFLRNPERTALRKKDDLRYSAGKSERTLAVVWLAEPVNVRNLKIHVRDIIHYLNITVSVGKQ